MTTSTKMTQSLSRTIVQNLLDHKYGNGHEENDEKAALGDAVYVRLAGKDLDKINEMPEGWLYYQERISVYVQGQVRYLKMSEPKRWLEKWDDKYDYEQGKYNRNGLHLELEDPLSTLILECESKWENRRNNRNEDHHKMMSLLRKYTTTKKLIDAWPEVEPFVNMAVGLTKTPAENLPAIQVSELNKEFNLPVE